MTLEVELETLRLLVAVDETGSLTRAGAARGISQPAASARVRAFESRWRLVVLERTRRGSELTTDGRAIVSWARDVLHQADLLAAGLSALSAERQNALSVAASLTVAEFILPRWLGELRHRLDGIHPRLQVVNSDRVAEMVREREVDLGFIETAAYPVDLDRRVVGSDQLVVVVEPSHPWARRSTPIDRRTMIDAEWVLREEGSGTRSTFERALRQQPKVGLVASSTTALIGAAAAGLGPAVIPSRAANAEIVAGRLAKVDTELDLMRPLTAVWRRAESPSYPATVLMNIAAADMRE
ncbi:LysR substrate-binding domain-containing protein [Aeromicrobium sp. CTD01-1L150]|uniref:LysR substrate-binding domain-containing protein n=1 Tax=Aeromicrobium sp. CTD01-1L150 TaxID=3341830 RepID=UPI0035C12A44